MTSGIDQLKDKIKKINSEYNPESIAEIGSQHGNDAVDLANYWNIAHNAVYIFEAHPDLCNNIKENKKDCNVYHYAVTDKYVDTITFNAVDATQSWGIGQSSLLDRADDIIIPLEKVKVPSIRMDEFLKENNINGFDIVKIDTEGCSYQTLNSFGEYIKNIDFFQIEAEVFYHWEDQYMRDDIVKLMEEHRFELIDEYGNDSQRELLFKNNRL